ncbi:GAF domain-containing protein [Candidatus Leptofilum sp.]|uniref:GAF domain-containing protein n=1 Tax=Candidatus Leptofilum sp. TaxID=3241576 RepID=UPI003B5CC2A5
MNMQNYQPDESDQMNATQISWWQRLIQPPASLTHLTDQRRAQLLFGLSSIFFVMIVFGAIFSVSKAVFAIMTVVSFVTVWISRTRYYQLGSSFIVAALTLLTFYRTLSNADAPAFLVPFTFLLATFLLPFRWATIAVLLNIVGIFMVPLTGTITFSQLLPAGGTVTVIGLLFIFTTAFRNNLERDRLKETQEANAALEELQARLNEQVEERTAELAIAAEVGHSLSQVNELNALLNQAAELIRDRFQLYHVNIYLANLQTQTLSLRAGSGQIGQILLQKGHTLLIGVDSINGNVALSKTPVIVPDTKQSTLFKPNRWLPETRSEMAVPLLVGNQLLGVLDVQASEAGALTASRLSVFETVASQLAIAVDNANLFAEVIQAKASSDAYLSRLTREGWENYLDAIQRSEQVSAVYDVRTESVGQEADANLPPSEQVEVPLVVANEPIGLIQVETAESQPWTEEMKALVDKVATQVAQQVENLRLIDEAQKYRLEAETAVQRLTAEGWENYKEQKSLPAYMYDSQQVHELDTVAEAEMLATVPLTVRGETIGFLELDGLDETLDTASQQMFEVVAQQLSNHIDNLRLTESSQMARANAERRNQELALINRMMSSVTASFDLENNMDIIAQELAQAIDVSHVGIALLTEDKKHLEVVTEHPGPATDVIGTLIPIEGNPLTEQAIETGKFAIAYDAQNNPLTAPIHDLMRQRGVHMLAVLPMIIGNDFFGTVGFDLTDPDRTMSEQQMRLAETIVFQATTVVQNARLFKQTEDALAETNEQARRLALLNEMSDIVSRQLSVEDIVAVAMAKVTSILNAKRISLHLIDDDDETMLRVVGIAGEVADAGLNEQVPIEDSPMGKALETRQIAQGYFQIEDVSFPAFFIPMLIGEKKYGTFNFVLMDKDGQLKENDRQIIVQIAAVLSSAFENLRLFDQTRQRAEREQLLNKIVTQVAASLDLQHSLQTIVDEMVAALNVDQVRVALIQPDGKELLIIAEHYDPKMPSAVGRSLPLEGNELSLEVIETREMVVIEDAQNNPRTAPVHEIFREQGIETFVLLPLVVNDEVLGTIGLDILDSRKFDPDTLQLAETIVYQAAVAIQNARLFEQSQAALAETETLYSYTSQLNTATNLDDVLDSAAAPGFQVGAADALLLVYDQDTAGQTRYGQYVASSPKNSVPLGEKISLRDQPYARLWPSGGKNILFVGDVTSDERLREADKQRILEMKFNALAIMFLSVGNLQLGQILIRWHNKQTFTRADERLYSAIAQQASSVVYNRLLFNQTEEALSETAALYQASVDLNAADTYEQVLDALRQHTILGQGSSDISVNLFNRVWEPGDMPETVDVLARWSTLPAKLPKQYPLSAFPEAETVLKPDEWLICADVATDERMGEKTRAVLLKRFQAKSLLYVPLVVGGQWIGFLGGIYSQPRAFPEAQIRRLNVLARQAAVSIQSLHLLTQTRRRADREALINSINQKIQAAPTVQFALQTAVTELSQALKLKKAAIELVSTSSENGNGRADNNGSKKL